MKGDKFDYSRCDPDKSGHARTFSSETFVSSPPQDHLVKCHVVRLFVCVLTGEEIVRTKAVVSRNVVVIYILTRDTRVRAADTIIASLKASVHHDTLS